VRICILTRADSLSWTQHYVDAFRQRAEVLTVGPPYDTQLIEDWGLADFVDTLVPNDIEADLDPSQDLRAILPDGWNPDLIVAIANGRVSLAPSMDSLGCPTAYITVDTWQSIADYVECQQYDFVFTVQRDFVDRLRAVGGSNVHWLPLGCNPSAHHPIDVPHDHDVAFVGNIALPFHQQRYDLLERLEQRYSVFVASRVFYEDLCRATCRGRLAFNRSAIDDVNMRVFEVMAMGRPLLTNRDASQNGLTDLFEDGKHLILYDDADDLLEKVNYYLAHEVEREAIAQSGFELVMAKHRYVDRVDEMLRIMSDRVPAIHSGNDAIDGSIGDTMADLVPFGSEYVVDLGTRLIPYAKKLESRGVRQLQSAVGDDDPAARIEVLAANSTGELGFDCLDALDHAYGILVEGGSLLLRLTASDFSAASGIASLDQLDDAFAKSGFHITCCKIDESSQEGSNIIVRARKRTRRLADIVREECEIFPHLDTDGLSRWAAAYGPHY